MGAWDTEDLCYKLFFQACTQGTLLASTAGVVLDANPEACSVLGYPRDKLRGVGLRSLVDASGRDADMVLGKGRLKAARKLELHLLRRNGSRVPVEASFVQAADGSDDNVLGVVFRQRVEPWDTADRLESAPRPEGADGTLGASEERFRALIENAQDFVVLADENNVARYASPAVERVLGYAPEEFVGTVIAGHVHPDDQERALEKVAETLPVPGPHHLGTIKYRRKDGSSVHLEVVVNNRLDDPLLRGVVCNCRDVSERVRQREELGRLNEELERRVEARTAQLGAAMGEAETSERMMRLTEERWRALIHHAADLTVILAADGTILYESPAVERILGFRPEERVGTNAFDQLHPDDVGPVGRKFAEVLRRPGERVSVEYRVRAKSGDWKHFGAIGVNLLDKPLVGGIVVNARDFTERKRTERALEQSEQRFRKSFHHAPIGMGLVATDGRWLQVNRALCEIVGYTEGELLGKTHQDLTHPDDLGADREVARRMLSGEIDTYQVEKRYVHKQGRVVWVSSSGSLVRGEEDRPPYFLTQIQNITERKEAEDRLREAEERYRTMVEKQSELVCRFLPDLTLTYVNEAYCRYFGEGPGDLIGSGFLRRVPTEDHAYYGGHLSHPDPENPTRTVEHRVFAPGGEVRWMQWTDTALFDEGGRVAEYQSVGRDVTDRREAEEALKRSEATLSEAQRIAHIGSWQWYLKTGELSWSEEVFRICGLDPRAGAPSVEASWGLVHPKDEQLLRDAIDETLGGVAPCDVEHRVVRPDGEVRWVHRRNEVVLREEGGSPLKMVGTLQDVTERKRAERRLESQHAVTRALEGAATFEEASSSILQILCDHLEWDVGAFWQLDRRADALRCLSTWNAGPLDFEQFEVATRESVYPYGGGFPGGVWASGRPIWLVDVAETAGFQRAPIAAREGLHGALAFPIVLRGEMLAIAEFFSCERRQPDAAVLEAMETIGAQVGQFVERSRAEEDLRRAERRYRTLIEQLPAVTYIQDAESNALSYVSPQIEDVLGYGPEEYMADHGTLFARTIHPDDREWVLAEDERTDRTGEPYSVECRRIARDGRVVWARDEAVLVKDAEGGELFWQGLLTDITERKRAEEALAQSEQLYRSVVEQAAESIFLVDARTKRILEVNAAFREKLGYAPEDLEGLTLYDVAAHDRGIVDANTEVVLREGNRSMGERKYRRKDGSSVDVEVNVSAISYAGREAMCVVAHDVTERKEAEKGLTRSLEVLLALREAGKVLGSTLEAEEVAARLLGIMRRVSNLTTAVISVTDEDDSARVWRAAGLDSLWARARYAPEAEAARRSVLEDEGPQLFRLGNPHGGADLKGLHLPLRGRERVLGILEAYGPEDLADDETIELISSLTNQAASALENALLYQELAERERRLHDLVAQLFKTQEEERRRVSYEVHDGLAQVATAAHQRLQTYARRYPPDSEKAERDLGRIVGLVHQTVGEARRIIGNLRPTALDDFGLAAAVGQVVDHYRGEGWCVSYEESLGGLRLPGPIETALFRVAQEALTNARKHAGVREARVELTRKRGGVRLRVRDEGRGFDPAAITTAGPGERVGLAGMRERVALLGGRFELRSRPGEGTAVIVDVPLGATEKGRPDGRSPDGGSPDGGSPDGGGPDGR